MAILNHVPNQSVCGVESVQVTMNYYSIIEDTHLTRLTSPHIAASRTSPRSIVSRIVSYLSVIYFCTPDGPAPLLSVSSVFTSVFTSVLTSSVFAFLLALPSSSSSSSSPPESSFSYPYVT